MISKSKSLYALIPRSLKGMLCAAFALFSGSSVGAQDEPVRGEDFVRAPAISDGLCVSNVFQSNMVIQRDKPVKVWGWANPGDEVSVSFAGQKLNSKVAADRSWSVILEPLPASSASQILKVQSGSATLELGNILVGDVWVLGGQSNMEFAISKVDEGMLEIVSANFPQIRLLTIPRGKGWDSVASFERLDEWSSWSSRHFAKGDWEVCTPETVTEFSAIGYVFGRRLQMATGVPIGLVDASVGGTTVETWTPEAVISKIDGAETKALMESWEEKIAAYDPKADLQSRIEKYERDKKKSEDQGKPWPKEKMPPSDLRPGPAEDKNRPGYCYSSMIRPLEGFAVKGALWHQGFNNCFSGSAGARMYYQVFGKMITAWRAAFADEKLPFCIISLCTAGDPQTLDNFLTPMYDVGALLREAQHQTYVDFKESGDEQIGFASSFDFRKSWYHPQIKVPVGERVAKWALVTQYGILQGRDAPLYWQPPSIEEVTVEGGSIRLKMSTDIKTADDSDGKMLGFAIAGDDRRFFPAEISYFSDSVDDRNRPKYQKNTLVLSSTHVPEPKHYRHAWARNPMTNLVNRLGIPIATQRSDDWILEETPTKLDPPEGMDERSASRWLGNMMKKELKNNDIKRRYKDAHATLEALKPEIEKIAAEAEKAAKK